MGFWSQLRGLAGAVTPNDNGPANFTPGDPDGIEFVGEALEQRELNIPPPTVWDGWPQGWDSPNWQQVDTSLGKLVDIAWQCLDLQSNIVSAMPAYQTKGGRIIEPEQWMTNPDPDIYTCWQEFAKQLFWDFQMGEAFVLPFAKSGNLPTRFRVIPPPLVDVDMKDGRRTYKVGRLDVTDDVLHLRYSSTTTGARGIGPLEVAGAKQTQIKLLQRYANSLAETGGVPLYWIGVERRLQASEAKDLMAQWIESRTQNAGQPAILGSNATLNQARTMNAKEMALLEISQFSESRIAGLLGVPPFLVGLAGASGSLCVDTETEILTKTGWKRYDEVAIGDETLTLNQETGISEWQPVLDVSVFDVVDRNMISMNMIGHSSFSTDDHQWPMMNKGRQVLRLTRDIEKGDALITAAPCADQPTEQKYSDAFVELVAWWYTEGNSVFTGQQRTAWLAQSADVNPDHCTRIRAAMNTLFGPSAMTYNRTPAWSEYAYEQTSGNTICQWRLNGKASEALLGVMEDIPRKVVKREFLYDLTPAQLELFIQVSLWADGCESTFTSFKQSDEDRMQIFELACHLAGKTVQRHGNVKPSATIRKRQAIKPVAANAEAAIRSGKRPPIIKAFKWTGRVWCPTTPNQTWFARRNGTQYFTHNTYSNIADLFDFHDRSSLRPKTRMIMESLSAWALPRGRSIELNRDDYTRLPFNERVAAYKILIELGVLTIEEVRIMERFLGSSAGAAAQALTGGEN